MIETINPMAFGVFLLAAAWQDGRERSVSIWIFLIGAMAGAFLAFLGGRLGAERILSCSVGGGLLLLSRLTKGAIGPGDGLFFAVSGLFLSPSANISLLILGVCLNGVFCALYFLYGLARGENMRKKAVPFLPFLVPVWLGMLL